MLIHLWDALFKKGLCFEEGVFLSFCSYCTDIDMIDVRFPYILKSEVAYICSVCQYRSTNFHPSFEEFHWWIIQVDNELY